MNYVIGDIQGCYAGLRGILKKVDFNPTQDKLWAVGDLIARGPDSLKTLEYCRDLGSAFATVLGNHDLHLLAVAYGIRNPKPQDKLEKLLKSKAFPNLVEWLKTCPLAIKPSRKTLITHAGLYPLWSPKDALQYSKQVSTHLNKSDPSEFLKNMYGNTPDLWNNELSPEGKLRFIVNAMTRMRYLNNDLSLEFTNKSHPLQSPKPLIPWYSINNKSLKPNHRLIFGHWASLNGEATLAKTQRYKVFALDTGYVWGNKMSLLCLENNQLIEYSA
ncbi:symmetrical bis(5'-nucleosyl)-tetraphosphatase [Agaribacter marinus]|uniref:bis(5'-nucleosyl)-tetraphosphatase (symmetrical) n=1 Tax=Agaribacter marinus TaxID=1431249 RepID=A0AA37T0P2_9ALTE|nr:symmetrical bis(5'-nucleosyl)-tetraphosphatase [Agaribacter marinus]GLR72697.1 bis(5'-nucleosyl)-tetraphosphatase, symmetrical [Agaribacter marinus]